VYYADIVNKLRNIQYNIRGCKFDESYELGKLANDAIRLIENTKDSALLDSGNVPREPAINEIKHTISKELRKLSNMRSKNSKKQKDKALDDAKSHLNTNIDRFITDIEFFLVDNIVQHGK
jgi:hypothetical protein